MRVLTRNVVVFPPASADQAVDSDVEDADDILDSDEEVIDPPDNWKLIVSHGEEQQPVEPATIGKTHGVVRTRGEVPTRGEVIGGSIVIVQQC